MFSCWQSVCLSIHPSVPPSVVRTSFVPTSFLFDKLSIIRPEFFYFLVLGKFLGKPSVGGGNKNKNKIQKFPESE